MKRYVKSGKDVPRKVYIDTIDIGECIADEPDGAYVEVTDLYNGYGGQIITSQACFFGMAETRFTKYGLTSEDRMFIFQLPAMIVLRYLFCI